LWFSWQTKGKGSAGAKRRARTKTSYLRPFKDHLSAMVPKDHFKCQGSYQQIDVVTITTWRLIRDSLETHLVSQAAAAFIWYFACKEGVTRAVFCHLIGDCRYCNPSLR